MTESKHPRLDRQLAELARDVAPRRDLWPDIRRDIEQTRHSLAPYWWVAAVAGIAASVAGVSTWVVMHRLQGGGIPVVAQSGPSSYAGAFELTDARYVAARSELRTTFEARVAQLDPATRATIETNLAVIRQAHEDIRRALASQPDSPLLQQLWESTWRDEFDLYNRVVQATQSMSSRT